jgi:ribosomal protein S27E
VANEQNKFVPRKRVIIYCDGCKTESAVVLDKAKQVAYCPVCGGCGIAVERVEWLKDG